MPGEPGLESEFADLMTDIVLIKPFLGKDGFGRPSYGDAIPYRARVVGRMREVQNAKGEDTVSSTTTVLLGSTGIDPNSQITLPEGFFPRTPPIIAVLRDKDDLGRITETLFS